ncbi:MAG: archaeosortase/exosortase family protein [Verrucomicrobiales bacterium]
MALVLGLPIIVDNNIIGRWLNSLTSQLSAILLSFFWESEIGVSHNIVYSEDFSIQVGAMCGAMPQILLSIFSLLVCYVCCIIKSYSKLFIILISTILVTFFINSVRISLLAYTLSIDKSELFDFWHEGFGSLGFSFVIMTITCAVYYYSWCRENPISSIATDENSV